MDFFFDRGICIKAPVLMGEGMVEKLNRESKMFFFFFFLSLSFCLCFLLPGKMGLHPSLARQGQALLFYTVWQGGMERKRKKNKNPTIYASQDRILCFLKLPWWEVVTFLVTPWGNELNGRINSDFYYYFVHFLIVGIVHGEVQEADFLIIILVEI